MSKGFYSAALFALMLTACTSADSAQQEKGTSKAKAPPRHKPVESANTDVHPSTSNADDSERKIQFIQKIYDDIRQAGIDASDYAPDSIRRSPALMALEERQQMLNAKLPPGEYPECDVTSFIVPGNGGLDEGFYARRTQVRALDNGLIRAEFSQFGEREAVEFLVDCSAGHCQIEDEFHTYEGTRYSYKESLQSCK